MERPGRAALIAAGGLSMLAGLAGALLLLGPPAPVLLGQLVLLSSFIVVTIAAERAELARLSRPSSAGDLLLAGTAVMAHAPVILLR